MIIVNLKGGLGNQMFQYALGYVLAKKKNCNLFCDIRLQEFYKKNPPPRNVPREIDLDIFGIKVKQPSNWNLLKVLQNFSNYRIRKYIIFIIDLFGILALRERKRFFEKRVFDNQSINLYLDGYWQSEKYFIDYKKDILKIFNFSNLKNESKNVSFFKSINLNNCVCLNVRRLDFLNNPEHNTVDINYYKNAIDLMEKKISGELNYYIFSDDIDWCEKNFKFLKKKFIVDHSFAGKKFINYLYLMTNFKFYIIPNSTFAWWGAWLSQIEKKIVIAPKKWSGLHDNDKIDIVPNNWIKL